MGGLDTRQRGIHAFAEAVAARGGLTEEVLVGRRRELRVRRPDGSVAAGRLSSRSSGDWQSKITYGDSDATADPDRFWAFVDLNGREAHFYIAPEWKIQRDIAQVHAQYLAKNQGRRVHTIDSEHHKITTDRVQQWRDNWQLLGL